MTFTQKGEATVSDRGEWDGFTQTLDMIRLERPAVVLKKKNGQRIASKSASPVRIEPPASVESWLWRMASRPECFLAILMLNLCSELLAPL